MLGYWCCKIFTPLGSGRKLQLRSNNLPPQPISKDWPNFVWSADPKKKAHMYQGHLLPTCHLPWIVDPTYPPPREEAMHLSYQHWGILLLKWKSRPINAANFLLSTQSLLGRVSPRKGKLKNFRSSFGKVNTNGNYPPRFPLFLLTDVL